jgi:shikimate kinase
MKNRNKKVAFVAKQNCPATRTPKTSRPIGVSNYVKNKARPDTRCKNAKYKYLTWDGSGFCCNAKPDKNRAGFRKAVFLAGGPGSGKSYVASLKVSGMSLKQLGFKTINSDDEFEAALKAQNIPMTPDYIFSQHGQTLREQTKQTTMTKLAKAQKAKLGIIIDGTGKNVSKIRRQKEYLEKLGYRTWMVFVNTSLETAQKRNKMRPRQLSEQMVKSTWKKSQQNYDRCFKPMFGTHVVQISNDKNKDVKASLLKFLRKIQ